MGKWSEVECKCSNRVPLPNSDYMFGRPYRNKRRLTREQQKELEEWEKTVKNMYECGHRHGMIIEFWPGNIILLGSLIERVLKEESDSFKVFTKVGNWRCYDDERLLIHSDEALDWLIEIEQLQKAYHGQGNLPLEKIKNLLLEVYRYEMSLTRSIETRLDEVTNEMSFAGISRLKENFQHSKKEMNLNVALEQIVETLNDASKLCHASMETNNPIRMLW